MRNLLYTLLFLVITAATAQAQSGTSTQVAQPGPKLFTIQYVSARGETQLESRVIVLGERGDDIIGLKILYSCKGKTLVLDRRCEIFDIFVTNGLRPKDVDESRQEYLTIMADGQSFFLSSPYYGAEPGLGKDLVAIEPKVDLKSTLSVIFSDLDPEPDEGPVLGWFQLWRAVAEAKQASLLFGDTGSKEFVVSEIAKKELRTVLDNVPAPK